MSDERRAVKVDTEVLRASGGYAGAWTVLSTFRKLDGTERVVAESREIPGLLHIFAPHQLQPVEHSHE